MFTSARFEISVRQFACYQVFVTDYGWSIAYNMKFERDIQLSYKRLRKDVEVPLKMLMVGARAQTMGKATKLCESKESDSGMKERYPYIQSG